MDRTLFFGYMFLLALAFSIIFVESVLYKAILFIPLVFATLAWIGYYADYKENKDKLKKWR